MDVFTSQERDNSSALSSSNIDTDRQTYTNADTYTYMREKTAATNVHRFNNISITMRLVMIPNLSFRDGYFIFFRVYALIFLCHDS